MRISIALTMCLLLHGSAPDDDRLGARIDALTRDFRGTIVLYAKNLDTGREFGRGADQRVRTASTIKLPILCALESLIAAGKVRWDERLRMNADDKVSGSGVLADLEDGTELSIRNLATLMIVVSDNTATNLLLDRITADAVNDHLDTLGLTGTRSLRKVRGDGANLKPPTGWSRAGLIDANQKYGLGVSTPREMVKLLELLHTGRVVDRQVSDDIVGILARQHDRSSIARHTSDRVANKSGSLDALRSDVGIVYTSGGPIALAITVDDMPTIDESPDNPGEKLISDLTAVLVEALGR
jgi:beta-lactamase class A